MKFDAEVMSERNMRRATQLAAARVTEALRLVEKYQTDPAKEHRLAVHKCKACYYRAMIGGAAVTTKPCMSCGVDQTYGSTNTGVLCLACAKEHHLCTHCGGDLDMNTDRTTWPSAS